MSLRFEPDVAHADWWATREEPWHVLCTAGPSGFPAYTQVLHPLRDGDTLDDPSALLQVEGDLSDPQLAALVEVLSGHTSTPDDCFCCLWEGFGEIGGGTYLEASRTRDGQRATFRGEDPPSFPPEVIDGPRVRIPGREYLLFRGPLTEAGDWGARPDRWGLAQGINSPNVIWVADRAWFVATEIDASFTVVGGSIELSEELLGDDRFDARAVSWGPLSDPREVQS